MARTWQLLVIILGLAVPPALGVVLATIRVTAGTQLLLAGTAGFSTFSVLAGFVYLLDTRGEVEPVDPGHLTRK